MRLTLTDIPVIDGMVAVDPNTYHMLGSDDRAFVDATCHDRGIADVTDVTEVVYRLTGDSVTFTRDQLKPFNISLRGKED